MNAEHSWADAPIVGYMLEYCCNLEHSRGYLPDGRCKGTVKGPLPKPQRLKWDIPQPVSSLAHTHTHTHTHTLTHTHAHTHTHLQINRDGPDTYNNIVAIVLKFVNYFVNLLSGSVSYRGSPQLCQGTD